MHDLQTYIKKTFDTIFPIENMSMRWDYRLTTIQVNGSVLKNWYFESGNRWHWSFDRKLWVRLFFLFVCLFFVFLCEWTCWWDNKMTPRPSRLLYVRDRKVHTPSTLAFLNRFSETKVPSATSAAPLWWDPCTGARNISNSHWYANRSTENQHIACF